MNHAENFPLFLMMLTSIFIALISGFSIFIFGSMIYAITSSKTEKYKSTKYKQELSFVFIEFLIITFSVLTDKALIIWFVIINTMIFATYLCERINGIQIAKSALKTTYYTIVMIIMPYVLMKTNFIPTTPKSTLTMIWFASILTVSTKTIYELILTIFKKSKKETTNDKKTPTLIILMQIAVLIIGAFYLKMETMMLIWIGCITLMFFSTALCKNNRRITDAITIIALDLYPITPIIILITAQETHHPLLMSNQFSFTMIACTMIALMTRICGIEDATQLIENPKQGEKTT